MENIAGALQQKFDMSLSYTTSNDTSRLRHRAATSNVPPFGRIFHSVTCRQGLPGATPLCAVHRNMATQYEQIVYFDAEPPLQDQKLLLCQDFVSRFSWKRAGEDQKRMNHQLARARHKDKPDDPDNKPICRNILRPAARVYLSLRHFRAGLPEIRMNPTRIASLDTDLRQEQKCPASRRSGVSFAPSLPGRTPRNTHRIRRESLLLTPILRQDQYHARRPHSPK